MSSSAQIHQVKIAQHSVEIRIEILNRTEIGTVKSKLDKSFLNQMALDHKKTIALFRRESRSGSDPDLKAFATKMLPTLEEHLKMVRSLQTKGGPTNRAINERTAASAPH